MISKRKTTKMTNKDVIVWFLLFFTPFALPAQEKGTGNLEAYLQTKGLVNISDLDSSIRSELKYATTDNFTKTVLYDTLLNIYLHPLAANKLVEAQKHLKSLYPGYSLLVYDAVRPLSVQRKMYRVVQNTKYAPYVANPARTGLHNYGMAVDLTICDENNVPLDMGTPFDYFGAAAGINNEAELVRRGILTNKQVKNRELLRKVMIHAGFRTIRGEWWHFNAVTLTEAGRLARIIE